MALDERLYEFKSTRRPLQMTIVYEFTMKIKSPVHGAGGGSRTMKIKSPVRSAGDAPHHENIAVR